MSLVLERDRQAAWTERKEQGAQPKIYAASWVLYTMRKSLPPEQLALMRDLAAKQKLTEGGSQSSAYMERVQGGRGVSARDERMRRLGAAIRELYGYDQAMFHRVGKEGQTCFRGMIEGDSQSELATRLGYHRDTRRAVRELVQIVCEAASLYRDQNEATGRPLDTGREIGAFLAR